MELEKIIEKSGEAYALLTEKEKRTEEEREAVVTLYRELRSLHPQESPNRLFRYISNELNWSLQGVRHACIKAGLYVPAKDRTEQGGRAGQRRVSPAREGAGRKLPETAQHT